MAKEIKLANNELLMANWLFAKLQDLKTEIAVKESFLTEYLNDILRKNKEIPSKWWDIDMQKGVLFEKTILEKEGKQNGNNSKLDIPRN